MPASPEPIERPTNTNPKIRPFSPAGVIALTIRSRAGSTAPKPKPAAAKTK